MADYWLFSTPSGPNIRSVQSRSRYITKNIHEKLVFMNLFGQLTCFSLQRLSKLFVCFLDCKQTCNIRYHSFLLTSKCQYLQIFSCWSIRFSFWLLSFCIFLDVFVRFLKLVSLIFFLFYQSFQFLLCFSMISAHRLNYFQRCVLIRAMTSHCTILFFF